MKLAAISFTEKGTGLLETLVSRLTEEGYSCIGYAPERFLNKQVGHALLHPFHSPLKAWTQKQFAETEGLIYIGAAGIAVRAIAPFVKDKTVDPAVVVMDELGGFVISLLSGHLGGANHLTRLLAEMISAVPVITTGTDVEGKLAIDVWAKERGLALSDTKQAKLVSAGILEGRRTGFSSDFPVAGKLPEEFEIRNQQEPEEKLEEGRVKTCDVEITVRREGDSENLRLIPKALCIGVGCRKGTEGQVIFDEIVNTIEMAGYDLRAVASLSSISLKEGEAGLKEAADRLGVPFLTFPAEVLMDQPGVYSTSDFVKTVTGADNVCERSAMAAAGAGGRLIVKKKSGNGVTVAAAIRKLTIEPVKSCSPQVLIFGGTTEGRLLAEYCVGRKIAAAVCVVSQYGEQVLPESSWLTVRRGAMGEEEMRHYLAEGDWQMILDATHPYAREVTALLRQLCGELGLSYHRVVRPEEEGLPAVGEQETGKMGRVILAGSVEEAVEALDGENEPVLVTTGSKELLAFTRLKNYKERVFVRVLPDAAVLKACEELGFRGKQLIAMQGPFSEEMNRALLHQTGARYLVTKKTGKHGGFAEKMKAAAACGVTAVVIGRPEEESGISMEEAKRLLGAFAGKTTESDLRYVALLGMGMGPGRQITLEAVETLCSCDAVLGAPRMLESVALWTREKAVFPVYLGDQVLRWMEQHPQYRKIGVVYSGDVGFYSGAARLSELLQQPEYRHRYQTELFPGVSSAACLCARLGSGWEDVYLASSHGRSCDIAGIIKEHKRSFFLLGGKESVNAVCQELRQSGVEEVCLTVGERLGYPEERIIRGTPEELEFLSFDSLVSVLIEHKCI